MLVLTRKIDQKILVGDNVEIMVVDIYQDKVRLGITAPKEVKVHREEVAVAIARGESRRKRRKNATRPAQ